LKFSKIQIENISWKKNEVICFAEGMALGNYQYLKFKFDDKKKVNTLKEIQIKADIITANEISELNNIVDAIYKCKDLVNEPPASMTAVQLAKEAEKMAKEVGIKIEVFNKTKIESLKMGGLLAVNRGSVDPPTFTIMEWKPAKVVNKKPYILVGKGVVYDTGGMSLKPSGSMETMKCDMGGAAAVATAIYLIAKEKLPIHVIGLMPATDNRPSGNAQVPGDVIKMFSGSTVEVLNTDAEGRLILADALTYAKKYKPELVIDIATLTGAAANAIGRYGIVAMGSKYKNYMDDLKTSGWSVFERIVEFPFWEDFDELIKSEIADIKNIGGPVAGVITAGKFLEYFVDYPWIHLDIAGPVFLDKKDSYRGSSATGSGVRLFYNFMKNKCSK
jgi:leucyl aminopeptidase